MRVAALSLFVLLLVSGPLRAGDNAIDDPFDQALERVYQRALNAVERRARSIEGPLSRGKDPAAEAKAFEAFFESTFGGEKDGAAEGLGKGLIRDEEDRFKDLAKLVAVAEALPGWHDAASNRLAGLSRDLAALDRDYQGAVDDMEGDADDDVLDDAEVAKYEARFEKVADRAGVLFEGFADETREDAALAARLRGCGDAGGRLGEALLKGSGVFSGEAEQLRERAFSHLLDWRGGRSPSGLLFVRCTKDARERFDHAKQVLTESMERCEERLSERTVLAALADLRGRADAEAKREHSYRTLDRFSRAQDVLEDALKEIRADLATLLAQTQRDRVVAKKEMDEDLEAVLPLAARDSQREELKKIRNRAVERAEFAAKLAVDRTSKGPLPELLEFLAHRLEGMDLMIVAIGAWDTAEEGLTESMESADSMRDTALEMVESGLKDAVGKFQTVVNSALSAKRLARIDEIEGAYPGLRWTEADRVKRVFEASWDLAKLAPGLESLAGVADKAMMSWGFLKKFLPRLEGDQDLLDECVSDPDGFAAKELTNGLFNELDSLSFGSIADLKSKTTDAHFNALGTKEGQAVRQKLFGAIESMAGKLVATGHPEAKELASNLRGLGQRLEKSFERHGDRMNDAFDAIATAAEAYHDERQATRENNREILDDGLDDLGARIVKLKDSEILTDGDKDEMSKDLGKAEDAVKAIDDDAKTDAYESKLKEAEEAVEDLEKLVDTAERLR